MTVDWKKILFGYAAGVIAHRGVLIGGIVFITKPFAERHLSMRERQVLD